VRSATKRKSRRAQRPRRDFQIDQDGINDPYGFPRLLGRSLYDFGKGLWVIHCQIRENLPVEGYVRLAEHSHKTGIRSTVQSSCGIDTGNPEPAELALPLPPVAVLVTEGFLYGVFGDRIYVAPPAPIAFGHRHDPLAAGTGSNSIFCAWHLSLLDLGQDEPLHARLIRRVHQRRLAQMALPLGTLLGQNVGVVRSISLQTASSGHCEPLFGAAVALHFRHNNYPASQPFLCADPGSGRFIQSRLNYENQSPAGNGHSALRWEEGVK
jgi:hypothetical protein